MAITLKRTIWPVGHGAFYTEQFIEEPSGKILWTAVYDCGSLISPALVQMYEQVALFPNQIINAVFISHFDEDHVNGLEYLMNNYRVKKVYIPQLTTNRLIHAILLNTIQSQGGASVANQLLGNIVNHTYPEGTNFSEIPEIPFDSNEDDNAEYQRIAQQNIITPNPLSQFWIYFPINVVNKRLSIATDPAFSGFIHNGRVNVSAMINYFSRPNAWKIAQKIFHQYFRGGNNLYTMPVYSGLMDGANISRFAMQINQPIPNTGYNPQADPCTLNCIYMGDFVPGIGRNPRRLNKLKSILGPYWTKANVLQVPHHGSYRNYHWGIYNQHRVVFVSCNDNDPKHPSASVWQRIATYQSVRYKVTELPNSGLLFIYNFA